MAEKARHAMKEEDDEDFDGPITALAHKSLKKNNKGSILPKDELDDDDVPLVFSKAKKNNPLNLPKVKKEEPKNDEYEKSLKKKEVPKKRPSTSPKFEYEDDEDAKHLKSSKRKKEEKKTVVSVKKVEALQEIHKSDKKVKKVYELPGQKHDEPEIRDPLRIFYETLYEKIPTSEMAAIWMMERGLLPLEVARKVYTKKLGKSQSQKLGSPAKFATPVKKFSTISVEKRSTISAKKNVKPASKTSATKLTKRKLSDSEDDDDDFIIHTLGSKKKA